MLRFNTSNGLIGEHETTSSLRLLLWTLGMIISALCFAYLSPYCQFIYKRHPRRSQAMNMPPGPRGEFLYGNLRQFFRERDRGKLVPYLHSLGQYGDMTTLRMGTQTWVMLNSEAAINGIINTNRRITAERPEMPIAGSLVSHDLRSVIRRTAQWTEGRRVMQHLFSGQVLKMYGPWQELESNVLAAKLLEDPTEWHAHIYRYSTAVYYRMIMGSRLEKSRAELDEFQQVAMEFIWSVYRSPIDFFPVLTKWVPRSLQLWRPFWERMGLRHREISDKWWQPTRKAVAEGTANPSFVRDTLLSPQVKYRGSEDEAMYLATSVIAAGADNTRMALNVFLLAMIEHPQRMQHARVEIDALCGVHGQPGFRLPSVDDIGSLPYLSALLKEVLRWRPTVPLSPPHQLTEDLEYDGYVFPKGTNFIINVIAVSQAVEHPDRFQPNRFLNGNEDSITHGIWVFGGGKRICVGFKAAQQALFVAMARLIFLFNISARGAYDTKQVNFLTLAEPFPALFESRSQAYADLIRIEASTRDA